jgi:hypothetical protein
MKQRHNIKEHVMIMSLEDMSSLSMVRIMLDWNLLDLDVVMVNQFMFTFYRQTGFFSRNDTAETWYWERD